MMLLLSSPLFSRKLILIGGDSIDERTMLIDYSLLNDPNTGSPANVEASNLYKDNRKEYTKRVKETVELSWSDE